MSAQIDKVSPSNMEVWPPQKRVIWVSCMILRVCVVASPMKQLLLLSSRCYAGLHDYVLRTPTPRRPHAPAGLFLVDFFPIG